MSKSKLELFENVKHGASLNSADETVRLCEENHELKKRLAIYQQIVQHFPLPIFVKDLTDHYRIVNPAYCELISHPEHEVIGKRVSDLLSAPLTDRIRNKDAMLFKQGGEQIYELQAEHPEKPPKDVVISKKVITEPGGDPAAVFGVIEDVTDRKRLMRELENRVTEKTVELTEANNTLKTEVETRKGVVQQLHRIFRRLKNVQSLANIANWEWTNEGDRFKPSHALCRLMGCDRRHTGNGLSDFLDCIHAEDRSAVQKAFEETTKNGTPLNIAFRYMSKQGREGYALCVAHWEIGKFDKRNVLYGIFQDVTQIMKTETALQEEKALNDAILKAAMDCIVVIDHKGDIISFNDASERIFGFSRQQVIGKGMADTIVPVDLRRRHREAFNLFVPGKPSRVLDRRLEMKAMRSDGTIFPIELTVTQLNLSGPPIWAATIRDITIRQQVEKALRDHEAFLEDVLESIQDGVCVLDEDLKIVYANKIMKEWYTGSLPLVGEKCYECYHRRSTPCTSCPTLRAFETGSVQKETTQVFDNPSVEWAEIFSYPIHSRDNNRVTGVVEFVRNLTEKKKAEEQIRRSRILLQTVFDGISDPLIMIDSDRLVLMLNRAAMIYTGKTDYCDVIGKPCHIGLLGRESSCNECDHPVLADGSAYSFERDSIIKPGRLEQVNVFPLPEEGGAPSGKIVHITDITEKRRLEEEVNRSDRLSSLGQLAGGLAHEIRNPLTGISLFVEILLDRSRFETSSEQTDILKEIQENTQKIEGVIKRVMQLSKPTSTSRSPLDLNAVAQETIQASTESLNRSGIVLKTRFEALLPSIMGDSLEIQEVVGNLISNAVDVTPRGGSLEIGTETGQSSYHKDRKIVRLTVSDNGPGISPSDMDRLFTPFFTTKSTGTGLGLAISRRIVTRHGGFIFAENRKSGGCRFLVEFQSID